MEGVIDVLCSEHKSIFNRDDHNTPLSIIKQLYHQTILDRLDYRKLLQNVEKDVLAWNPHSPSRKNETGCHGSPVTLLTDEARVLSLHSQPNVPLTRTNVATTTQVQQIINDGLKKVVTDAHGPNPSVKCPVALSAVYGTDVPDKHQSLNDLLIATRTHEKYTNVQEPIFSLADLRTVGLAHNWLDSTAMVNSGRFLVKHSSSPIKWHDIVGLPVTEQAIALMLYPAISASSKCPPTVVSAVKQFESNLEKMKADLKAARESKSHVKQANWADLMLGSASSDGAHDGVHANVSVAPPSRLTEVESAVTDLQTQLAAIQAEKEAMEAKMKKEAEAVLQRRRDIDNKRSGMVAFLAEGGSASKEDAERAAAEKFPYPYP